MIVGTHVVVASKDAEADHRFFREVLNLNAVDAGGGYLIFGLPASEASIHPTEGDVPLTNFIPLRRCRGIRRRHERRGIGCGDGRMRVGVRSSR
jgi:hypothetical protein